MFPEASYTAYRTDECVFAIPTSRMKPTDTAVLKFGSNTLRSLLLVVRRVASLLTSCAADVAFVLSFGSCVAATASSSVSFSALMLPTPSIGNVSTLRSAPATAEPSWATVKGAIAMRSAVDTVNEIMRRAIHNLEAVMIWRIQEDVYVQIQTCRSST